MTTLSIPIRVCIWVLILSMRLLKLSWVPLGFAPHVKAKILCSCLCLFDAIIELHAMNEKNVQ